MNKEAKKDTEENTENGMLHHLANAQARRKKPRKPRTTKPTKTLKRNPRIVNVMNMNNVFDLFGTRVLISQAVRQ